ncbi:MAG: protein translocase subunit SecF [Nitrospirae bacterium]|nr:protein translocase subunit SecF [Nitrospirota bacterium]
MVSFPKTSIDFVKRTRICLVFSGLAIAAAFGGVGLRNGLNPGIDFTGGIELQIRFEKSIGIGDVRSKLGVAGLPELSVQTIASEHGSEFLLKMKGAAGDVETSLDKVESALQAGFPEAPYEVRRTETVGPKVGRDLSRKGALAFIFANVGILIYLAFRFHWVFGLGAVVALIHDALITGGALLLGGFETNITTIAAILTVIGFSVNDTIVVYDRIRENMRKLRKDPMETIINKSVNETLSRTVLTSLTVFFVSATLYFFGGQAVKDFSFAMLVGVITGTYSSVFIASPILLVWKKRIAISGR